MTPSSSCPVRWTTTYLPGIAFSELESLHERAWRRAQGDPSQGTLLVSEPQPTLTRGRGADARGLLFEEAQYRARGIAIAPVSRGGQWTFHGPGQVVVYPIVRLRSLGYPTKAVVRFLAALRGGLEDYLRGLGLEADTPDPRLPFGVYVKGAKLASFGLSVERGVSRHGLAFHVGRQELGFEGIHPCGVPGQRLISLEELGAPIPWKTAAHGLVGHLLHRLTCGPRSQLEPLSESAL